MPRSTAKSRSSSVLEAACNAASPGPKFSWSSTGWTLPSTFSDPPTKSLAENISDSSGFSDIAVLRQVHVLHDSLLFDAVVADRLPLLVRDEVAQRVDHR